MNKLTEPWWLFWLKWQLWRRFKGPRYQTYWHLRSFLRHAKPGIMVDCGANVGDISTLFLERGFTVHAFEPDPDARAILENRLGKNPRLHIYAAAVDTQAGRMMLHREADTASDASGTISSSLIARDVHDAANGVEVKVIDLFEFISGLENQIDFLKLDIEGSEAAILEKILDLRLDRHIDKIFIETHERFSTNIDQSITRSRARIDELGITNIDLNWR